MIEDLEAPSRVSETPRLADAGQHDDTAVEETERLPYAIRIRTIFLLSLISWAILLAALAWAFA